MTGRLESSHLPFLLSARLVRVLGSVVPVLASLVLGTETQFPMCSNIAPQLVRDHYPGGVLQPFEKLAEKPLCCLRVVTPLDQDIQDVAILVHCPPQVVLLAFDPNENFIKAPSVTRSTLPGPDPLGVLMAKTKTPLADSLVSDVNSPTHKDFFDISEAEGKAVVQPHRMADDLAWVAKSMIG